MTCLSRYADAWQFSIFFCPASTMKGLDNGGGVGVASLTDNQANFQNLGIHPNQGMILYNLTTGLSGPVTAVTPTTLTATGVLWTNGQAYRITALTGSEIAAIEMYLEITAADINAALAATNSCACTWQSWVPGWLDKLNIIEAAAFYSCPCGRPNVSDDARNNLLLWATEQLKALRDGEVAVCEGDTGKNYPAVAWAEIAHSDWEAAQIINNYDQRSNP
jgi:hypothetical protein